MHSNTDSWMGQFVACLLCFAADARAFRRALNKSPKYNRRTVNDATSLANMESDGVGYSRTGLVAQVCPLMFSYHAAVLQIPSSVPFSHPFPCR